MRLTWIALAVAVVVGVAGTYARAEAQDPSTVGPTVIEVVQADTSTGSDAAAPEAKTDAAADREQEKRRIHLALNLYGFIPSNSTTRDNFGTVWGSFGIGRFRPERPQKWVFDWDATLWSKNGDSNLLIIPVSVGAQRGLSSDPDRQAYVAVRVGGYWGRVSDNLQGPDDSAFGANANVALGMVVNQKYVFEARYDWFSELAGNNLDGLTLTAGVKVLSFSY